MRRKEKIQLVIAGLFLAAAASQLYLLRELKNSTSWITWADPAEVAAADDRPDATIAGIRWPADRYASSSEMEPFRQFYESHCKGLRGIDAASCVSNLLIERVPFGEPSTELFQPGYSPLINFQEHLAGKAGHCVSYSGITANVLLSAGIPARMIQTLPRSKYGHTIVEVFDEENGWTVLDPLSDSLVTDGIRPLSAIEAHRFAGTLTRKKADPTKPNDGHLNDYFLGENPFKDTVMILEPWIHSRSVEKVRPVVRGSFVAYGDWNPKLGLYQKLFFLGIPVCVLAALTIVVGLGVSVFRRGRASNN